MMAVMSESVGGREGEGMRRRFGKDDSPEKTWEAGQAYKQTTFSTVADKQPRKYH